MALGAQAETSGTARLAPPPGGSAAEQELLGLSRGHLDPEIQLAIERALAALAALQKETGAFSHDYQVAITSLVGLAYLGYGHQYGRGEYGSVLVRAVDFLTQPSLRGKREGYISDDRSRMHGHAYAILFLSQVLGSMPVSAAEERLRIVVRSGAELIARAQTARGGWGYEPGERFDESSITVCCLQALRACKDAGIELSEPRPSSEVVDGAIAYLRACCLEDGSFRYSLAQGIERPSYELTAAAVSTLDAAGAYAAEEHRKGVQFMRRRLQGYRERPIDACSQFPFYGNFYAAQVFHQLGGEAWETWAPPATRQLLAMRQADNLWHDPKYGKEYATAMALLILEVPLAYLPIFER